MSKSFIEKRNPWGGFQTKGRAVSEAQNLRGQVSLWNTVTLGLKPVEEGTWRDAGDLVKGARCLGAGILS